MPQFLCCHKVCHPKRTRYSWILYILLHPFNGLFFLDNRVSWLQKGRPFWIFRKQEITGWQWHQLDHMQIICFSFQTDNHVIASPLSFRSSPERWPNKPGKNVRPSVRTYIHPSVRPYVCTSTIKLSVATNEIVVFVKVDETFTTIWFQGHPRSGSRSCET